MRNVIRFFYIIIVLAAIGVTVYFINPNFLNKVPQKPEVDMTQTENNKNNEENNIENNVEMTPKSDLEIYEENIENLVESLLNTEYAATYNDNLGEEYLGNVMSGYVDFFETNEVNCNVFITETSEISKLMIMPMPDFFDNQVYYYDENQNLVLYVTESVGVGGCVKYYFKDGELIDKINLLEENLEANFEEKDEILRKFESLKQKYLNIEINFEEE